jgi:hypothetical protein
MYTFLHLHERGSLGNAHKYESQTPQWNQAVNRKISLGLVLIHSRCALPEPVSLLARTVTRAWRVEHIWRRFETRKIRNSKLVLYRTLYSV